MSRFEKGREPRERMAFGNRPAPTVIAPVSAQLRLRSLRRLRGTSHPFGGSAAMRDAVESRSNSRRPIQGPKRQGVCGSTISDLSILSPRGWGFTPGPSEQPPPPQEPPMRAPDLPGDFVSEQLRADCTRFLEELRVLVRRRAVMLEAQTDWPPAPAPDDDVDGLGR